MATHGFWGEFYSAKDLAGIYRQAYTERLHQLFVADDIDDAEKKAILISMCGPATYQLIHNLQEEAISKLSIHI